VYSSYLGGTGHGGDGDYGEGVGVDLAGNAYVTGYAFSTDFPVTAGAYQMTNNAAAVNGSAAFVAKVNAVGSKLVYATYLGGSGTSSLGNGNGSLGPGDLGEALAVDKDGSVFVAGIAGSTDFPTTLGVVQSINNTTKGADVCYNAFITKLNPGGTEPLYSTYLGGRGTSVGFIFTKNYCDGAYAVRIDQSGNAYIVGDTGSSDFPVTKGAFKTKNTEIGYGYTTAFVAKLNPKATSLTYSTYLGGAHAEDFGTALAVDVLGDAYVSGTTYASDFPVTLGALQTNSADTTNGNASAYLAKLDPAGSSLLYSTFLGGSGGDEGNELSLDQTGNAYLTGITDSTDFPVTKGAFQSNKRASHSTAFLAKFTLGTTNPIITSISTIWPDPVQPITVTGSGFGSKAAYTGDSIYIRMSDITQAWNAGSTRDPGGDQVGLVVKSWSDSTIQLAVFSEDYGGQNSLVPGDEVSFEIWNAETGQGPASYHTSVSKPAITGRAIKGVNGPAMPFVPVLHLGSRTSSPPFVREETAVTDTQGYYFFSRAGLPGEYIKPVSSGGYEQRGNPNQGPHGYLFAPNFCQVNAPSGSPRACEKKGGAITFTASTKPSSLSPRITFKMPLPAGSWTVVTEAGGYALTGGSVDADPSHTDLSTGFYALDIAGLPGTPVLAAADGTVAFADSTSATLGFGNCVIVKHSSGSYGGFLYTRYAHLESWSVQKGQIVKEGQQLGLMGSTGESGGPHVHFQLYHCPNSTCEENDAIALNNSAYSLSGDSVLRRVEVETESSPLALVDFIAGGTYQSTNPKAVSGVNSPK
jgi:murein DD-endopeptidase MepM/ murein hydrolase activator NlpD